MRLSEIELIEYSEFDLHHEFFEEIAKLDVTLFENHEDYAKLVSLLDGFATADPKVGNSYCYASVSSTPVAKIINIAKFNKEYRLIDIQNNRYVFEINGRRRAFPEQGSIKQGNSYQHIFMFDSVESCNKLINWLGLNYSGNSGWRLSTKQLTENFADGRKPGRKGLSQRVGIPKKTTIGQLEKIAQNSTGERRRMAQWQLNMRRGKAKT